MKKSILSFDPTLNITVTPKKVTVGDDVKIECITGSYYRVHFTMTFNLKNMLNTGKVLFYMNLI